MIGLELLDGDRLLGGAHSQRAGGPGGEPIGRVAALEAVPHEETSAALPEIRTLGEGDLEHVCLALHRSHLFLNAAAEGSDEAGKRLWLRTAQVARGFYEGCLHLELADGRTLGARRAWARALHRDGARRG